MVDTIVTINTTKLQQRSQEGHWEAFIIKIIYQEHNFASSCKPNFKMIGGDDPMSRSYSYRSIDSPDIEYDVPSQQKSEFFYNLSVFDDWSNEDQPPIVPEYQDYNPVYAAAATGDHGSQSSIGTSTSHLQGNSSGGTRVGQAQRVTEEKFAFKIKSQVEILDDGFKWRKYGKKMVKNSPNPRNYYRCSAHGCSVKKRVEKDVEDVRYVITTYEGVHNHQRPPCWYQSQGSENQDHGFNSSIKARVSLFGRII